MDPTNKNKINKSKNNKQTPYGTNLLWKSNPPGPEQMELNRLFENGEIGDSDTANIVRLSYPMFRGYSSRVFGLHFRKTKAKYGKMRKYKVFSFFINIFREIKNLKNHRR